VKPLLASIAAAAALILISLGPLARLTDEAIVPVPDLEEDE